MPISEGQIPRFNWSIIPDANFDENWNATRVSVSNQDASNVSQSRPYYSANLSGCMLNQKQENYFSALKWKLRGVSPLLMRVAIACEGGEVSTDASGNFFVTPTVIGMGDGELRPYQLKRRMLLEGYEDEYVYHIITKPHIDYPVMKNISDNPVWFGDMPELRIYVDGTEATRGDGTGGTWSVDRNSGVVTTDAEGQISWTGGFYTVMLLPQETPRKMLKAGLYEFESGVRLFEPFGSSEM